MSTIATSVAEWLSRKGNTRELLSERLGLREEDLNSKLAGKREWYWSEVLKVSELTGVPLSKLR